jgi:predicted nucleic acid-binding Zn ribbon protein
MLRISEMKTPGGEMPFYTFQCRKCGQITQEYHGFKEPHPIMCFQTVKKKVTPLVPGTMYWETEPEVQEFEIIDDVCGGDLVRIFDVPNVHYHGSGFYSTDKLLTPVKPEDYNPDED